MLSLPRFFSWCVTNLIAKETRWIAGSFAALALGAPDTPRRTLTPPSDSPADRWPGSRVRPRVLFWGRRSDR